MKRFFKVLLAAWLTGAVLGGGCFCGAVASGMLVPKKHSDDYALVQCQIAEIQTVLEELGRNQIYDSIAADPIDEFAGLE